MGFWDGIADTMTGTVSDQAYAGLPQVQGPNAQNYQIPGLAGLQGGYQQLGAQPGVSLDTGNMDQTRGMQMGNIGQLQAQANGTGPSPAQVFMQNNQQQALRNLQAQALSSQAGANPGLAFRGLMNAQGALQGQLASQGALMQQQAQQQAQLALASQLQGIRQQDFGQASEQAGLAQGNRAFQAGMLDRQAGLAQSQQQNNQAYGQAQQNYSMFQRADAQGRQQALAQRDQGIARGIASAAGTGLGALAGGLLMPGVGAVPGAMMGGQLASSLFGGAAPASGMDPRMLMALQNGGSFAGPTGRPPMDFSGMPTADSSAPGTGIPGFTGQPMPYGN